MGARQRQVSKGQGAKDHANTYVKDTSGERSSRMLRRQCWSKRKYLTIAGVLAVLFLIYIGLANDVKPLRLGSKAIDNLAISLNLHKPFYVVIIDAGSTASRVIAFTFHVSVVNGQLILDDELFYETKPGLSSYAKNPKDVKQSLDILLQKAKGKIPQSEWSRTPLSMRATAGLRLLPGHRAQDILEECKKVFNNSGFKVSDDSVAIMEGSDEGIFAWFTANFLLERFPKSGSSSEYATNTVAALDLGGGSTQVTYAITPTMMEKQAEELAAHEKNLYNINAFDRNISVFTQSFLGMGLMAARKEILMHADNYKNDSKKPDLTASSSGSIELRAECINPIISGVEWNYGGKNYLVKGPLNGSHKIIKTQNFAGTDEDRPIVRFSTCLDIIKKVVNAAIPHDLPNLEEHEMYAFSYYFERATEVGLIDPFAGGVITIESLYKAALETCEYPNTDQPFMCLDLSFIYTLLHDGFGLDTNTKIFLRKKVNGHEMSWALGAAFNVLQKES
ncbi:hypothetical protein TSAR_010548 [Trichomalopsis sarcophagae]|uniref:Ectonucleoside triphosphate diphosphohydrolase 5 n=1 Tax=Trichomalopsis sarcophagae TaxID=543379 RepID=A0A232F5F9_9HYME|nr:hypothetical protein TSAR_010548 [Trichomalopsis sarcophagae]